ncbi:DUF4139 domain-containing protein [Ruegeria atlantica]|uniref:DUF4139 domain-containing protein n=1 Tax=Ruegeria atlantica TaxID=81569 RepID=UPI00147B98E6|nr:DUF4139 domain-containing protein [Ruegeria atlantica]
MRILFPLLALLPIAANAETFSIKTKVTEATIFPEGAEIIRTGSFSIPPGNHRLLLPGIPAGELSTQFPTIQVVTEGLKQTALVRRIDEVPDYDLKSDAQRQVEIRVKDIERRIRAVEDEAGAARLQAEAAHQTIQFLGNLGRNEGLVGSGVEELRDLAQMVGDESLRAGQVAQSAEIEARKIEERLTNLTQELEVAQAELAELAPEIDERLFVAVDVTAETATEGVLTVSYLDTYAAEWGTGYEFHLATGDAPQVRIDRSVLITQHTGENWHGVNIKVSTIEPSGQNAASRLHPKRRLIQDEPTTYGNLEEPVVEAPVVVEETQGGLPRTASVEGTGVTYSIPTPISVASGYEFTEVALDTFSQSAEMFALAVPMRDDNAFRTVKFTNPLDQSLMESSLAKWFVDGVLVAAGESPEIGPREEVEMGFGPIHGLTTSRAILNRSSGDSGIISRSNQRVEQTELLIKNLTDRTWPLRVIDQIPYSEQDDLQISWSAQPRPTEENLENKRGILAWDMDLTPGQNEKIQLDLTLKWPEGMILR